jgi:hypothetical protein
MLNKSLSLNNILSFITIKPEKAQEYTHKRYLFIILFDAKRLKEYVLFLIKRKEFF